MAKAVLRVQGLAYCAIEIENSKLPPSVNIIDHIHIYDGFGIAIPTLELNLFDPSNTLSGKLGFTDATKITITLTREGSKPKVRIFRVWGWNREVVSSGPVIKVTAVLDVPKWSAGCFCESFSKQLSSQVISAMATRSDCLADVDTTSDKMTWLNINTTRNAFSEDVAMRGYIGPSSCMSRILTMDKKVRYKDIIKVITGQPKVSFLLNVAVSEASASPVPSREAEHMSSSGVVTYWMNYGWTQHEHDLSGTQKKNSSVSAPLLGSGLPINSDMKKSMQFARVTYTGMDSGTDTKPESNLHANYEKALYQNLRFLALFSERMRVLTDNYAEAETFDCCEFKQDDPDGQAYAPNKTFSGKYLIGGKSIHIQNGHRYYEVYDLYRPYVNENTKTSVTGQSKPLPKANDGSIPISTSSLPNVGPSPDVTASTSTATKSKVPALDSANNLMSSLKDFDNQNPKIPTVPTKVDATNTSTAKKVVANAEALQKTPLAFDKPNLTERDMQQMHTTMKIDQASVTNAMNSDVPQSINILSVQRTSPNAGDVLQQPITSVISRNTAQSIQSGDRIGDVQAGGYFKVDFDNNNISLDIDNNVITEQERQENSGALFLKQNNGNPADVLFSPFQVAQMLQEFSESTSPMEYLATEGAEKYISVFGTSTPDEAQSNLNSLNTLSKEVQTLYDEDEYLTSTEPTVTLSYGDPSFTPIIETVTAVKSYNGPGTEEFKNSSSTVESQREIMEWSDYYRIGNTEHNKDQDTPSLGWEWPLDWPLSKPEMSVNSVTREKVATPNATLKAGTSKSEAQLSFNNLFSL